MANKYSFELSMDTKGYVDGAKAAEDANADFTSSLDKTNKELPNLRKELAAAKKETTALALAYKRLSDSEKQSGFGKAMAKQLEEAKKKTAELIDLNGDLSTELKNMASDTAGWDAMKEGIGVAKDSITALITTTADLTGTEAQLAPVLQKIAQVQTICNTAISVGNALQKQSALMNGVRKVQEMALAKSIDLEAAATGRATIAQRVFNAVAKANPYVLLASAVIAAGAALGTFMLLTRDTTTATEKLNQEIHDLSIQAQKDAAAEIVQLDALYKKTQDLTLSMKDRKAAVDEIQSKYPAYLNNFSQEAILAGEASAAYKQLREDIIAVALARAAQDKITEKAKNHIDLLEKQKKAQEELAKAEAKQQAEQNNNNNMPVFGGGGMSSTQARKGGAASGLKDAKQELYEVNKEVKESEDAIVELQNVVDGAAPAFKRMAGNTEPMAGSLNDLRNKASELQKQLDNGLIPPERIESTKKQIADLTSQADKLEKSLHPKKSGGSSKTTATADTKPAEMSITALEKKISDLQKKMRDGLIPEEDIKKTIDDINGMQAQIKTLKIKYGFETEKAKSPLEDLQDQLSKAKAALPFALNEEDVKAAWAKIKELEAKVEAEEIRIGVKVEPKQDTSGVKQVQKVMEDLFKPKEMKFDFSALKDSLPEDLGESVQATLDRYEEVKAAREQLTEIMNDEGASDAAIAAAQAGLEQLDEEWQKLVEDVETYNQANQAIVKAQKNTKQLATTVEGVGNAVSAASQLFAALGEASEDNQTKAMAIVAQAIATIALSFAKALTSCKTWVDWLAFGITGLATMVTMITQVKNLSAGSYAAGGIIPGSSYYGDKLTANVSSGEMILNRRQQKNLFDIANGKGFVGNADKQMTSSISSVAVEGSDLVLAIKNELKTTGGTL